MSKKINIAPAKNLNRYYGKYFEEATYPEPYNKVTALNNAVLLFNGIVINNGLPVKDSYYQYPESRWKFIKKAYEQYIVSTFARSRRFIHYTETPLIAINQPWFNFYHWLLESLPRLYLAREHFKDSKLILPASYLKMKFVTETLALIKDLPPIVQNNDENYRVKTLHLPALRPYCHAYNINLLHNFKNWFTGLIPNTNTTGAKKIFLVRRKAAFRRIHNSTEIESILKRNGFEAVDLEDYDFNGQVNIMRQATHVIAQHGAGLSHILFMQPGTKVMELHKEVTNAQDHVSLVYWSLASAMQVNYYYMFCKPLHKEQDFFKADIYVDPKQLETELGGFI